MIGIVYLTAFHALDFLNSRNIYQKIDISVCFICKELNH